MSPQKAKAKPSKPATSKLANPVSEESSLTSTLFNAFSPSGDYFAIVHRPASSCILRIHETVTSTLRCEHAIESAAVSSLSWINFPVDLDGSIPGDAASPTKKRKKKSSGVPSTSAFSHWLVAIGLANGAVELYSPEHSAIVKRLDCPRARSMQVSESCKQGGKERIRRSGQVATMVQSGYGAPVLQPVSTMEPQTISSLDGLRVPAQFAGRVIHRSQFNNGSIHPPDFPSFQNIRGRASL